MSRRAVLSVLFAVALLSMGVPVAEAAPPVIQTFTATRDAVDTNKITLSWKVTGGNTVPFGGGIGILYIFDRTEQTNPAVGFKPVSDASGNGITITFHVREPGIHRYTLGVENSAKEVATKDVFVDVPFRVGPEVVAPANNLQFVEILNPPTQPIPIRFKAVAGTFGRVTKGFDPPIDITTVDGSGNHVFNAPVPSEPRTTYGLQSCEPPVDSSDFPLCGSISQVTLVLGPERFIGEFRSYIPANQALNLSWTKSRDGQFFCLASPTLGIGECTANTSLTVPATSVVAGRHRIRLLTCFLPPGGATVCAPAEDTKEVIVGQGAWTNRSFTADFVFDPSVDRTQTYRAATLGALIETLITSNGDRYANAEFGQSLFRVTPTTGSSVNGLGMSAIELPLLRNPEMVPPTGALLVQKIRPYVLEFKRDEPFQSEISAFAESLAEIDGKIWLTQGGGTRKPGKVNRSRIVRFDPAVADDPATIEHEGMCSWTVPENDNEVFGITGMGNRIYFLESADKTVEPAVGTSFGRLTSFVPSEIPCETPSTLVDATVTSSAPYCTGAQTTGCFRRVEVPFGLRLPTQLAPDPSNPQGASLWISGGAATAVGRYRVAQNDFQVFPLPPPAAPGAILGSFPWEIRVSGNFVYVLEFGDADLVRLNRATASSSGQCTTQGANPCMVELPIPLRAPGFTSLWMDIEPSTNRLWFQTSTPLDDQFAPQAAVVGFADISNGMLRPGVIYTDVSTLSEAGRTRVGPASFNGIAVRNGVVSFADFLRGQLLRLRPK